MMRIRLAVPAVFAACLLAAPPAAAERLDELETWGGLLGVNGHDIVTPARLPDDLDPGSNPIVVVTDPGELDSSSAVGLRSFVNDGGRLIVLGDPPDGPMGTLAGSGIEVSSGGPATQQALVPIPETAGVESVELDGGSRYESTGALLPAVGGDDGVSVAVGRIGEGAIVAVPDPSFLTDDGIQTADNALLALRIVGEGDGDVTFATDLRAEEASGLGALPDGWLWATAGLVLAALALVWARARRVGPVEQKERELPPPRRVYLEAMAAVLVKAGGRGAAAGPIRREALRRLGSKTGLRPGAGRDEILHAAERAGLDERQAGALAGEDEDERTAIAAGSALAALTEVRAADGSG